MDFGPVNARSRLATATVSQKNGREGEWSALILLIDHEYHQQLSELIAEKKAVFFQQALTDTLVEDLLQAGDEDDTGH